MMSLPLSRLLPALLLVTFLVPPASYSEETVPASVPDAPAVVAEPRVQLFSPQGWAKSVRQVRVTFSEPMVPIGDPGAIPGGANEPFAIDCPEKGQSGWEDSRNWVFNFERDLPGGVRCEFRLKPEMRTLAGLALAGGQEFWFSTGGPAVLRAVPWDGGEIQEDQAFVLELDSEADEKSVLDFLAFEVQGVQERIGAEIVGGKDREELLAAHPSDLPRNRVLIVRARRPFPPKSQVRLVWGRAIQAKGSAEINPDDQAFNYKVRDAFTVTLSCERENADAPCIPLTSVNLEFSNTLAWERVAGIRLRSADGREWRPKQAGWSGNGMVRSVRFDGPFPENREFRLSLPPEVTEAAPLRDESDRPLQNASSFPLIFRTGTYPPLAKFAADFGILELNSGGAGEGALLPVALRNVEPALKAQLASRTTDSRYKTVVGRIRKLIQDVADEGSNLGQDSMVGQIAQWMLKIQRQNSRIGEPDSRSISIFPVEPGSGLQQEEIRIEKPSQDSRAFEVVGVPFKKPGFYVVELESLNLGKALLGQPRPMYVSTAVLVTNLAVHWKKGRETSLAWVTTLDQARPVEGAWVEARDCKGKILGQGRTDARGVVMLPGLSGQTPICEANGLYSEFASGIFVSAEKDNDFSFAHSSWNRGLETWRYNLPYPAEPEGDVARTVFDRTLVRGGDRVHMKHYLRRQSTQGFAPVPRSKLPTSVEIQHLGTEQKTELPLKWEAGDVAVTEWTVPSSARLGTYAVSLVGEKSLASGDFRVEEFRVPLMKGRLIPPASRLVAPWEKNAFDVDLSIEYLAGGGAGRLPVQVRSQQEFAGPEGLGFDDFEGFTFANGAVKEELSYGQKKNAPPLKRQELALDPAGSARFKVEGLEQSDLVSRVRVEAEYRDPNGEIQTVSARVPVYPSGVLVGLRADSAFASIKAFRYRAAVVDPEGKPQAGVPVEIEFLERKIHSHRKKLVGGFYAYEHRSEVRKIGKACEGRTGPDGMLVCEAPPPSGGNILLQARTRDEKGNPSLAHLSTWIYEPQGGDGWWFEQGDHDRIDLIPEKRRYESGETARFQVRMPFKEATALVSVEREGVMDSWVVPLSAAKPVIEVPVLGNYAPNAFVSVLVVRGRVTEPQPTALVDLGKPAYKLGLSEIRVGWRAHELAVKVVPERRTYKIREKAKVKIQVALAATGGKPPKGTEVLLAAVDEGLLELRGNDSWKLLEAMMGRRGYAMETFTAQTQIVGKRHFGLKALPHGGDGGKAPTRELFDTLLFWKARVPLNAEGVATVEMPLKDSVTAFRVVAVATNGLNLYGTGETAFRVTQDLAIFAGIPQVVREGDRFPAEFTVRNTSDQALDLEVGASISATGVAAAGSAVKPFEFASAMLEPGATKTLRWDVEVPAGAQGLKYDVSARARNRAGVGDRVRLTQKVVPAVPVRVAQSTLAQLDREIVVTVEPPAGMIRDRGGIRIALEPSITSGLKPARDYMKRYPFTCFEQELSKAITLREEARFRKLVDELPSYLDSSGLLKYFPGTPGEGSDVLTSYALAIVHEAGWDFPGSLRQRMMSGLMDFVSGKISRVSSLPAVDLAVRKLAAVEALSRWGEVNWSLLASVDPTPQLWPTSALLDWWSLLRRVKEVPERADKLREAESLVRARLDFHGTRMGFASESSDRMPWLMISGDVNANRLVLEALEVQSWKEDLPRLVRGTLARQELGRWSTTPANAWGALALEKFAEAFEAEVLTGRTSVSLGRRVSEVDWKLGTTGRLLEMDWPEAATPLRITHQGSGKPWATIQSQAAIPLKEARSSGFSIQKTWTAVERRDPSKWSKGDIIRVRLELDSQADQTWVVLSDPVPAGASILGTGLGRDSQLASQGPAPTEEALWQDSPTYEERSLEAFRAYFSALPKGRRAVEYTLRLNQSGKMQLPPTHAEAMYAPEVQGDLPNEPVEIQD